MHRWFGTEPSETVQLERRSHSSGNDADTSALQLPERFVVPFLTGTLDEKEFVRNVRSIQVRENRRSLQSKKEGSYNRNLEGCWHGSVSPFSRARCRRRSSCATSVAHPVSRNGRGGRSSEEGHAAAGQLNFVHKPLRGMCAVNKLNIFAASCSCICGLTCSHLALRFPPAKSKLWPSNPVQKLCSSMVTMSGPKYNGLSGCGCARGGRCVLRGVQEMNGTVDEAEVRHTAQLFGDLTRVVSAKQLAPMLRTQVRVQKGWSNSRSAAHVGCQRFAAEPGLERRWAEGGWSQQC